MTKCKTPVSDFCIFFLLFKAIFTLRCIFSDLQNKKKYNFRHHSVGTSHLGLKATLKMISLRGWFWSSHFLAINVLLYWSDNNCFFSRDWCKQPRRPINSMWRIRTCRFVCVCVHVCVMYSHHTRCIIINVLAPCYSKPINWIMLEIICSSRRFWDYWETPRKWQWPAWTQQRMGRREQSRSLLPTVLLKLASLNLNERKSKYA